MSKKSINIDWSDLELVFEVNSDEVSHFLDLETGKVLMYDSSGLAQSAEETEEIEEQLDSAPNRYYRIENQESYEVYRWMENFAESQTDERVREFLLFALNGPKPFRRFKDALHKFPEVREKWFEYEREHELDYLAEWVMGLPVDIANPPDWLTKRMK